MFSHLVNVTPWLRLSIHTGLVLVAGTGAQVLAATITLDFEGVNGSYPSTSYAYVNGYYDGGTSSDGTSGTDYGIGFSANARTICLNSDSITCSGTSRGGLAPGSATGGLWWSSGSSLALNVPQGFTTGITFYYTYPFDVSTLLPSVEIYEGSNGTGQLLGLSILPLTPTRRCAAQYNANAYCPYVRKSLGFDGVAKSLVFTGRRGYLVLDDITLDLVETGVSEVPVPSSLPLMASALVGLGLFSRRTQTGTR